MEFKAHSYGFRPNRNAHQAVLQARKNINEGYQHVVDIDLENFFDEVDHCLLLQLLYRKVKCSFTLRLIRKWIKAPILVDGKLVKRGKGVPQGSPCARYCPIFYYMNWIKSWRHKDCAMSATQMTLVFIQKVIRQPAKQETIFICS